jgi:hypothetical protein
MRRDARSFGEPVGPWTSQHSLGAAVVLLIFLGLGLNIWPGWDHMRGWIGG